MKLARPNLIETQQIRFFIGSSADTDFIQNETVLIWKTLMPQLKNIQHRIGKKLFAIDCYPSNFSLADFHPAMLYTKMACVEISNNEPQFALQNISIPPSLFAVFKYTGTAANAGNVFAYIFNVWAKDTEYLIDFNRPLFCEMDASYNPTNENETELIWIPIKPKTNEHSKK